MYVERPRRKGQKVSLAASGAIYLYPRTFPKAVDIQSADGPANTSQKKSPTHFT